MKNFRSVILGLLLGLYGSSHAQSAGSLSLYFEENHGQAPADARFLARGRGYSIVFTPDGNHVMLRQAGRRLSVGTRLVDANPKAAIHGEQKQPGKVHYLRRAASMTDIPTYARVRYERVYPGIDLIYYGNQQQLEYDFVVNPGSDPTQIALRFEGADKLTVDPQGNLVLEANKSQIVQHKPIVYQRVQNSRKEIKSSYRLLAANTVAFDVGPYDHNSTLVIDPILTYSTFLGGSNGDDDARAVATDSGGNLYITGSTTSTNFQTAFAVQPNAGNQDPSLGVSDAFVTKLNGSGTAMIYSTYFGGSGDDDANAIAVDSSGNAVIAGSTQSTDFPTTDGALRRVCNNGPNGCLDAFVVRLNATGSIIIYSTYLGGSGDDEAGGVASDSGGSAYITGRTDSPDFITTAGAYSTDSSAGGFLTKLSSAGAMVYSTYFGTIFGPADPRAIAVDAAGNTYLTGSISVAGSITGADVFITKMNPFGTAVIYTQTIRGAKDEVGNAIALDAGGSAYVAGQTTSINFPTTSAAVQPAFGGGPAFRSTDSAANWSMIRSGITRTSLYALAVAPGTPSTIYVGADDEAAGGLFKSADGGDNWTNAGSGLFDARIHALAVDPATPATVYAGSRTLGVYKSTNAGTTWSGTSLNNVFVTALAIDPSTPATVYAGTDANGVYKSTNSGATWFAINSGLVTSPVRSIVVDPNTSTTLYAATSVGIYKSSNSGANWASSSSGLLDPNINAIALDPRTPNVLFAGTNSFGIFRSANGGGLWTASNGGLTSSGGGTSVSALTIDPVSGTLYAAVGQSNAMSLYKSSNGITWTATSLATARLTALAVDRSNSGTVYAATVGGSDAFVAKWNSSGSLVYSTYLGGYRDDVANAIGTDPSSGVYIAGSTSSTNFPIASALQPKFSGGSSTITDAFLTKLDATGSGLSFSTYLGGSSDDFAKGIAVDSSNTAYVVGVTSSTDFPTTAALNPTRPGLLDAFVVKVAEGSAASFSVPTRGGFSATSQGTTSTTTVGYARVQQNSGGVNPAGLAIFGFRQNNVLVSEAAVPATALINTGRIYAEVGNSVNTGLAIANPNAVPVTISYYFTDRNGQNFGDGTASISANSQIAAFLDQSPFYGGSSVFGTFTFVASQSVAVIALRGFTNERGEFLITTLPVSDSLAPAGTEPILFPHYADGGGWTTQILLVNTTDAALTGSVQFAGLPSQDYSIAARSTAKIATAGTAAGTLTGSARVTPTSGSKTPAGVAVFSFKNAGITVSEAGVPALRPATAFRLYAESSGVSEQIGSIRTGIALANPSANSISVTFELTTITGVSTGLTNSITLQGNGQTAMFVDQIPGFGGVPNPFQGILRVSTTAATGVAVVGLRGRYNERRDFLITTTQPAIETASSSVSEQFFPHFADGGGYTTQFILFAVSDQPTTGVIRFFNQSGQSLGLGVR